MHCFYIEPPRDGVAALPREEARHAARVLRLKRGDAVCAMDGAQGRWEAVVESVSGETVTVRLGAPMPANEPPVRLTVYQGLPKAEKLDFVAQKLTELGAFALSPVKMERCVVRLDERDGQKRRERLERIAAEAAKQCRRAAAPRIDAPLTWAQALERLRGHELALAPWEEASARRMKDAFAEVPDARDIALVIGPEGGMSEAEVAALEAVGVRAVTLGPRILRTETAAVVAAALAMQLWGDL